MPLMHRPQVTPLHSVLSLHFTSLFFTFLLFSSLLFSSLHRHGFTLFIKTCFVSSVKLPFGFSPLPVRVAFVFVP